MHDIQFYTPNQTHHKMKNLNVKHALISSIVVYLIGITSYIGSYFVPLLDDQDLQANLILMIAIIPAVALDEKGGRIGSGEGYYDRLIPNLSITTRKVALALEAQIIPQVQIGRRL